MNWYSYCAGDPVNAVDPSGLAAGDIFDTFDEMLADASSTLGYTVTETSVSWSSMINANGDREYFWSGQSSGNQQVQNIISAINAYNGGYISQEEFATNLRANGIPVPSTSIVTGGGLRVPIYNQLLTEPTDNTNNLCWATSTAMVASFILGDTTDRTLVIAQAITGQTNVTGYNQPWCWVSTNDDVLGLDITVGQIQSSGRLNMAEIIETINQGNPFGVLYNDGVSGHWIVGIGFINVQGGGQFVISNDPWGGVQRIQNYNDFLTLPDGRPWAETAR